MPVHTRTQSALLLAQIVLLAGGCALAEVNSPPSIGQSLVRAATLDDGKLAVLVYRVRAQSSIREQWLADGDTPIRSLSLHPGRYVLEVECTRPGAVSQVDNAPAFPIQVDAGRTYLLDCLPGRDDNGFVLTEGLAEPASR